MAAFSNVNADGVPLNVSQAVQDDTDARNLAGLLRGPRRDPYYEPARSLSTEDEAVHAAYERMYDIVNNPEKYDENQINDAIVEITEEDDSPVVLYGRFDGNYNADLADERESPEVLKYYKSWKRNHKNWEKRGLKVRKAKLESLKKLDKYKISDDMSSKQKRDIREKLMNEANKTYSAYMYGKVPLGRQIYYLIEKAEEIQRRKELGSDSDSSELSDFEDEGEDAGAAAVMSKPSPKGDSRPKLKEKEIAALFKAKAKVDAEKRAVKASAKPEAKASAKPSVKVMFGDEWIGPFTSRSTGKQYWTRRRDKLGVFVDSKTGELTERNIRKTEEHNANKASKKGGRRKTRKMKGGHHLYKRLGVSKYASQKQIKKAYNKLKKKKKLTQKVKYAYKILSKKKSRKKYNAKYKKMKKSKKKRRRRGGIPSIIVKGKIDPPGYNPRFNIPDPNASQPAWLGNL